MGRRSSSDDAGESTVSRRDALGTLIACAALGIPKTVQAEIAADKAGSARHGRAPWMQLPPTPQLPEPAERKTIDIGGVPIFYARFGKGEPVVFLHGGMANSNYWGHQIRHLSERFSVIAMDTRGHGRSPLGSSALSYPLFARDTVGLLDALGVRKVSVIGWSDGAITGLELAMGYPERVERLFAFAGNVSRSAMKRCAGDCPTFVAYTKRCKAEYATLSPNPEQWPDLMKNLRAMWHAQPEYEAAALARIKAPTVVADGQYDEIIRPSHAVQAARLIPEARALSLPNTSHFAMLQEPARFNAALDRFLSAPA